MALVYSFNVDGKVYVGVTENPKYRWRPSAYRKEKDFYSLIEKHGWKNVKETLEILLETENRDEAIKLEGSLINQYKNQGNSLNNYKSGNVFKTNPNEYRRKWVREYRNSKNEE